MKLLKKILLPALAAVTAAACVALAACGETNPDANLTEDQYVVYVYLDDGETPVKGVVFNLCYNTNSTQSTCSINSYTTDSDGRVLFDMTEITYVDSPVIHIKTTTDTDAEPDENGDYPVVYQGIPDGYGLPANASKQTLNGNASYDDAWTLTEQVTTLVLTKS
ncbi:MAG: hypothetical protein LUD27_05425 [Clostridia bacterium]|nr:hypothetical protein [Clostridia bacterium]